MGMVVVSAVVVDDKALLTRFIDYSSKQNKYSPFNAVGCYSSF